MHQKLLFEVLEIKTAPEFGVLESQVHQNMVFRKISSDQNSLFDVPEIQYAPEFGVLESQVHQNMVFRKTIRTRFDFPESQNAPEFDVPESQVDQHLVFWKVSMHQKLLFKVLEIKYAPEFGVPESQVHQNLVFRKTIRTRIWVPGKSAGRQIFRANAFITVLGETELVSEWHKAAENVHRGRQEWENGTTDTYASLALRKIHHNKVISCEAQHPETNTNLRDSITLDVYYSSDRPKIDVIGTTPAGMVALESGQNITLLCTAEGYNPPPQLIWSNQNGRVNEEYSYDMENQLRLPIHSSLMPSQTPCATGENAVQFDVRSKGRTSVCHTLSWFRGVKKLKETQNSLSGDSSRSTVTLLLDRSTSANSL
uniref:Ig-like domain-containing protein n=1 Tax=Globodera rostochiensis TaxID=31243 RepID=A0A914H7Q6_GLORO